MNKFITSPIYYINGKPHIGHLYTSIAVDILSRFEKMIGKNTFTSFGTDEHGQKVELAAINSQQNPIDYTNNAYLPFKQMLDKFNIQYSTFIRTTSDKHKQTAVHIWNKIMQSELVYKGKYSGWYSKVDEAFYKEDEIADGKAIETGSQVEWVEESCLFFALSKMRTKLYDYYINNPQVIQPKSKYAEVLGLLASNLPDLAISRSRFTWGIPVPNEDGHVMYVWIDALSNYLTALNYPINTEYNDWWSNVIHVIGKDILKFHAIYWPAFLMAANINPPARIVAHGWWTVNGQKMSKSIGNVIDPFALSYDVDCIRYYMFREVYFGNDGNFSDESVKKIINSELVNELGNLVQRVLVFCQNKFGSTISCSKSDIEILNKWDESLTKSIDAMNNQDITGYLNLARDAVIATNKYIDTMKPWSCNIDDAKQILGVLCLCVQRIAILYSPIIPNKSNEIIKMLGINHGHVNLWDNHVGYPLYSVTHIFSRIL